MVDFFNRIYAGIVDRKSGLKKIRYYSFLRFFVRKLANLVIPVYFRLTNKSKRHKLVESNTVGKRVIVSLTSFPARITKVWLVIETILRQTHKPDMIILWLSKKQFSSFDALPPELLKQTSRGLQIRLEEEDLRSHKKYYYTIHQFPEDIMITVDDDILYPTNTVEELMHCHAIYPEAAIARYGLKIKTAGNMIAPYQHWEQTYHQDKPDFNVFFGSGGGTLFPPHSLPHETLNKEAFIKTCLYADDIWLNTMCRINNTKVFKTQPTLCSILPVLNKNDVFLSTNNLFESQNDESLKQVRILYGLNTATDPYWNIIN